MGLKGETYQNGSTVTLVQDAIIGLPLYDPVSMAAQRKTGNVLTLEHNLDTLQPFVLKVNLTGGVVKGDVPIFAATAPFKFEVIDVVVIPAGAETGGVVKVTNGTNDITDDITCAVDKTIDRAATIDDAYSTIASGGTLELTTGSSGTDQCAADVFIYCARIL